MSRGSASADLHRLLASCERDGTAVFFFGSQSRIVYMLRDKVGAALPRLKIVGICDADFEGRASAAIVDFIAGAKPGLIILDMAEREARIFCEANAHRFPGSALVHLDGAFGDYVLQRGERRWWPRAGANSRPGWAFRPGLSALRFSGVILSQLLQGGRSRLRGARTGAAMRRD